MKNQRIPKDRWRFLFQHRLLAAQNNLSDFLQGLNQHDRAFVAPALSTRALVPLIDSLAGILDDLAAPAVLDDLQRLSMSAVLYQQAFEGTSMTADRIAAVFRATQPMGPRAVSHQVAYERYVSWILGRDRRAPEARRRQGSNTADPYVETFFQRHPLARYVIDLICQHFVGNITEACTRILADRAAIARVFFAPRAPVSLSRITSTGSDFHKGGHQVLILEFALGDRSTARLVYKPSDLEIDYLLVGRNIEMQAFLAEQGAAPGFPAYTESLAERLNRLCADANATMAGWLWRPLAAADLATRVRQVELATYKILARNPGSRLAEVGGRLPIENSYGYVEFLTHDPALKTPFPSVDIDAAVARELQRAGPPAPASDWVTADASIEKALFYQWGQWMVLALIAGTSDVHVQNQLVHALKPHVIDLEESFKFSPDFKGSYIAMHYNRPDDPGHKVRAYGLETSPNRSVPLQELIEEFAPDYSKNQLYVRTATETRRAQADRNGNLQFVFDGIQAAAHAVRTAAAADDIAAWLTARANVVVRHVPQTTGIFTAALRAYYSLLLAADGTPALPAPVGPAAIAARLQGLSRDAAAGKLRLWAAAHKRPVPGQPPPLPPPPFFLLETSENNLRDYANFDIPYYVRRVGEDGIRNSDGRLVNLQNAWAELGSPTLPPNTALPATYFQQPIPAALVQRVNTWRQRDQQAFIAGITDLINNEFRGGGDLAFLHLLLLRDGAVGV